jgi:uncharacterized protein
MKLKKLFLRLISFYQKTLAIPINKFLEYFGLLRNNSCVFYPTCSEYTKEAIKKYGILKGIFLGFKRILRCHPWQKNHIDYLK